MNVSTSDPSIGYELGIPSVAQRKTLWCWAAVSEMCGQWIFREESNYSQSTTRNQADCVRLIKHGNNASLTFDQLINQGASDDEYQRAMCFVTTNNQNSSKFTATDGRIYTMDEIDSQIFEWSRPIAIAVTNATSGHAIAIKGTYTDYEEVCVNDPWNQGLVDTTPNNMNGPAIERTVLYDDLVNNGYIPWGTETLSYRMTIIQNN